MRLKLFLETFQKIREKEMGVTHTYPHYKSGVKVITQSWA